MKTKCNNLKMNDMKKAIIILMLAVAGTFGTANAPFGREERAPKATHS